ncbi:MAG: hypothetical protein SPI74_00600 [Eubacterium sp.]|nr:hypothetical protein [Eubacterium sp.]
MNEKLESVISKIKHIKNRKSDRSLKIMLIICILGFAFFFSSRYIFPKVYRGIDIAIPGDVVDMENYIFTLDSWDYAVDDKAFEIILSVQNLTLNKNPKYDFVLKADNDVINTKVYRIIKDERIVLRAYNVPRRWTEVTLSISAGRYNSHIGMNDKEVHKTDKLRSLSNKDYEIKASKALMDGLKVKIIKEEREIKKIDEKINYAYDKLVKLEEKKEQQTEKEKEQTNASKSQIANEMERLKGELDVKMAEYNEHKAKFLKEAQRVDKLQSE